MPFSEQEIFDRFESASESPDRSLDCARLALDLAILDHPGISTGRYVNHLGRLAEQTGTRHEELLSAGAEDNVETRLAALKHVFIDIEGYQGDMDAPARSDNLDLVRVIDRRKGSDIALAVLYLHAARACGWHCEPLELPGHFALRLDHEGGRIIFSPFAGCRVLNAADMREIVKEALGPQAELSADYYEPVSSRDMLIALGNALKLYYIETEDYPRALKLVEIMRKLAPDEYRLLLDAGVLYARTNRSAEAVPVLEAYIAAAPGRREQEEAAILLEHIRPRTD